MAIRLPNSAYGRLVTGTSYLTMTGFFFFLETGPLYITLAVCELTNLTTSVSASDCWV